MNKQEKAIATFKEGFSCSQAILSSFGEELNLNRNTALKLSDSFGGGMGGMALICGVVTGAFMVIGLKYGRTSAVDREAKQKTTQLVREFSTRFKKCNNSLICKELLGCDISTDEGFKRAKETGLINTICPKLVIDAVEILEEIL